MMRGVASLAVAAAVLAGCAGGQESATLGDGRYFGYVRAVDVSTSPPRITIDVAAFLTGDEADRAAEAARAVEAGEKVPNDYFIRNDGDDMVVVPVARDVRVRHVQCAPASAEDIPGSFGDGQVDLACECGSEIRLHGRNVEGRSGVALPAVADIPTLRDSEYESIRARSAG